MNKITCTFTVWENTTTGNRESTFRTIRYYLWERPLVQFSSPEHCHFFTFYTDRGVKCRLSTPLSLKFASNEQGGGGSVRNTLDYHFPPSDLGSRGTTYWFLGVGTLFSSHLRHFCTKK